MARLAQAPAKSLEWLASNSFVARLLKSHEDDKLISFEGYQLLLTHVELLLTQECIPDPQKSRQILEAFANGKINLQLAAQALMHRFEYIRIAAAALAQAAYHQIQNRKEVYQLQILFEQLILATHPSCVIYAA